MKISPEDIYKYYHYETNSASGRLVRMVKKFDNAKAKDTWIYFEQCATLLNRNKMINLRTYLKAISQHFEGWFDPKILVSPKGIKIYKQHIKKLDNESSPKVIKISILKSIKYVVRYCKLNELKTFSDYLNHDMYLIPPLCKHFDTENISPYFLACIQGIEFTLGSYPKDCIEDYMSKYLKSNVYRTRIVAINELYNISQNLDQIINRLIKKQ